jgi:hypothetical protein
MDTTTLVDKQIDEGKQLVDHLRKNGFDVAVAFWVLATAEERWFFYIASTLVETDGLAAAFRKVYSELSRSQVQWISRSDIRLIGSQSPLALDAIAYQSSKLATRYGGRMLGNLIVEEAYIYPK